MRNRRNEKREKEIIDLCKRRGIAFESGGYTTAGPGLYDFGDLGVLMKRNIKKLWLDYFVFDRDDIYLFEGATLSGENMWKGSGHHRSFDFLIICGNCKKYTDPESLKIPKAELLDIREPGELRGYIVSKGYECPNCRELLKKMKIFPLIFRTETGHGKKSVKICLRPETCQSIFVNFKRILHTENSTLPFGVAHIGKAYRNEIAPRQFIVRCREFELLELEYFINPAKDCRIPYDSLEKFETALWSDEMQHSEKSQEKIRITEALQTGVIRDSYLAHWMTQSLKWLISCGIYPNSLRCRQHLEDEKPHYSKDTWDIEYLTPSKWVEVAGISDRGSYDLREHMNFAKNYLKTNVDLKYFDGVIPRVVESSFGMERVLFVLLLEAYLKREERLVLRLDPRISPIKVAVLPLENKKDLVEEARLVYDQLRKVFHTKLDVHGSIGRRYVKFDEIGTPCCITIDFRSLVDGTVTIREITTWEQKRAKKENLAVRLKKMGLPTRN